MLLRGVLPALVTPFTKGEIDLVAFRRHVEWVISEGVDGVVPLGTTGEAGALSFDESRSILQATVDVVNGRVPIIAGAGANITTKAIALSQLCAEFQVDGLLHATPYYNKPTQRGLLQHFTAIAKAVSLPIILYNVPGRTGVNMSPSTVAALAKIPSIVGLKDACGSAVQSQQHILATPAPFVVLSGDDALNHSLYQVGHQGAISVTANVAPRKVAECWRAWAAGDKAQAQQLHEELLPLNKALFLESNPIPVKTALAMMDRCQEEWRLPLCAMEPANRAQLATVLEQQQLINTP
jgi:4-hydroxy-tetrahydrodipicolinate synthase